MAERIDSRKGPLWVARRTGGAWRLAQVRCARLCSVLSVVLSTSMATGTAVAALPAVGAAEAAAFLAGTTEGNRLNAIATLVRSGRLQGPLTAAECASILAGTTHGSRAAAVAELARSVKADLTGHESAAVLGSAGQLSEGNRLNAIAALGRAGRFGLSLSGDAALTLAGTTQGARAAAVAELAPHLRTDLAGVQVAAILGNAEVLSEGNRHNAIAALTRSSRISRALSSAEVVAILAGTTHGARAGAIGELSSNIKNDLTGQEAGALLGTPDQLSEGNRVNAISALARAGRFGPSIGGDAAVVIEGTTHGSRAAAIGELARYLQSDLRGAQIAAVLGSESVLNEGNRQNAIAALARAHRIPQQLTAAEAGPVLAGVSHGSRAAAIAELATYFVPGLSGTEAGTVLGASGETTEGNRFNGIASLVRAGKLRPGMNGSEVEALLRGMSEQARGMAASLILSSSTSKPSADGTQAHLAVPPASPSSSQTAGMLTGLPAPMLGLPTVQPSITNAGSTPSVRAAGVPLPKLPPTDMAEAAAAYEFALLADAAYSETLTVSLDTREGKISWVRQDRNIQYYPGTKLSMGFKASTYHRDRPKGNPLCAIVFAGTDGPEPVDWMNNILQAIGMFVPEYEEGVAYVQRMSKEHCSSRDIFLVGHSLGGGIAQYAFARTGGKYQVRTFNSAGLSFLKSTYWNIYTETRNVVNFVAEPYSSDGRKSIGHEPASITGALLGRRTILVPAYGYNATHRLGVITEGIGIQRDYCLAAGKCI